MNSLQAAVFNRAVSATPEMTGGWHRGFVPPDVGGTPRPMPYGSIYGLPEGEPDYDTEGVQTEPLGIRFSIFGTSEMELRALVGKLEAAFVLQSLDLTAGAMLQCTKAGADVSEDPDRAEDGEEVWQAILDLEFLVERTPGQG